MEGVMSPWLLLLFAILLEVAGTTAMRMIGGWNVASIPMIVAMLALWGGSLATVTLVIKRLDIGVTYAVWAGIGTVATALVGYAVFAEPLSTMAVFCMGLIVAGVVGLNLSRAPA